MSKLNESDKEIMKLIQRSPDQGDGWRTVSSMLWKPVIVSFTQKELLEIDEENQRVRLSPKGIIVADYIF